MIIYLYNPTTKEYLGQEEAKEDLMPSNPGNLATIIKPPSADLHKVAVFDGTAKWSLVDDFRGTYYDKIAVGVHLTVENIDDSHPGAGYTDKPAPDTGPYEKVLWSDEKNDWEIVPLSADEKEEVRKLQVKAQIAAELPDLIYQNKDNAGDLAQALCDRAKEIDQLIKISKEKK